MQKVLITGGAGFIGSHLAEHLLAQGQEVYILDDLSTGRRENLVKCLESPHCHFIQGSVLNSSLVAPLIKEVDEIYHLAASVGVKLIVEQLVGSIGNNVQGTEIVLRLANVARKRVLLTSTSEVYGRSNTRPFSEEDDLQMGPTLKSRWSYACSKALDEYLAFAYYHEFGLPVTVVRLFNTVGERQTDTYGMVLPSFVKQALHNEPLTIYGDGQQTRCFCHVSDVAPALAKLMAHPEAVGQVFNVGSTEEISIEGLADRIIEVTNSRSQKAFIPYTEAYTKGFDDISRRVPDISKIQRLINFNPSLSLDAIITQVATHLKSELRPVQVAS